MQPGLPETVFQYSAICSNIRGRGKFSKKNAVGRGNVAVTLRGLPRVVPPEGQPYTVLNCITFSSNASFGTRALFFNRVL